MTAIDPRLAEFVERARPTRLDVRAPGALDVLIGIWADVSFEGRNLRAEHAIRLCANVDRAAAELAAGAGWEALYAFLGAEDQRVEAEQRAFANSGRHVVRRR